MSAILRASIAAATLFTVSGAHAAPTKEECVEAHAKGQDARDAAQLVRAGKLFLTCAQAACPDLVQRDCARLAEEIDRQTPTITFAARDGAQRDLLDTTVYVDGALVASQLGDGKAHEIDPGRHEVRFVRGTDEAVVTIVVSQGEKGRAVIGTFAASPAPTPPTPAPPTTPATPDAKRPSGPLVLTGLGLAAMAAGGVLLGVGFAKMPAACSLSTHTCATPSNDPSLADASRAVTFMNVGGIVGGAGSAALVGSLIWYFAQPAKPQKESAKLVPWVGSQAVGASIAGSF